MRIACWDHCDTCEISMNRFWVKSEKQFEKERAETLGHKCMCCGGPLKSYHEDFKSEDKNEEIKTKQSQT